MYLDDILNPITIYNEKLDQCRQAGLVAIWHLSRKKEPKKKVLITYIESLFGSQYRLSYWLLVFIVMESFEKIFLSF